MKGILTSQGNPLDLESLCPILGYQATHIVTGRLLPMCNKHEIYSIFAMYQKMEEVARMMDEMKVEGFEIFEYDLVPIYEGEVEGYVIIENFLDFM